MMGFDRQAAQRSGWQGFPKTESIAANVVRLRREAGRERGSVPDISHTASPKPAARLVWPPIPEASQAGTRRKARKRQPVPQPLSLSERLERAVAELQAPDIAAPHPVMPEAAAILPAAPAPQPAEHPLQLQAPEPAASPREAATSDQQDHERWLAESDAYAEASAAAIEASLEDLIQDFRQRHQQANHMVAAGIGSAVVLTLIALSAFLSLAA